MNHPATLAGAVAIGKFLVDRANDVGGSAHVSLRAVEGKPVDERAINVSRDTIDEAARTVDLAFSSDAPYERWWGVEILDHAPGSVRLGRLNGAAAVLVNHDPDEQVGVVDQARIDSDRKGRAQVRFGKSADASEVFQDVIDGIRQLVSVGYIIHAMRLESETDGVPTYRVTDWEPFEVSIVAIPADTTVGVGRAMTTSSAPALVSPAPAATPQPSTSPVQPQEKVMPETVKDPAPSATPAAPVADVRLVNDARAQAQSAERQRVQDITAVARRFTVDEALVQRAIDEGSTPAEFNASVLDIVAKRGTGEVRMAGNPAIGMTPKEVQRFSVLRAIDAAANPSDIQAQRAAAFEIECSNAAKDAAAKLGTMKSEREAAVRIPSDVMSAEHDVRLQRALVRMVRDLTVIGPSTAGQLVPTELSGFIDLLRNAMSVMQAGATMFTDLNGNLAIPRQTGGVSTYWVAENAAGTEGDATFDQVSLTPKSITAYLDFSRRLARQSSIDVEAWARAELATVIGLGLDYAALNGSGSSNQPRGVMNVVGIGAEAGGTNGAAPTWDNMVNLQTLINNANAARGPGSFITNTKVRGKLLRTQKFGSTNGDDVWGAATNTLAPAIVSNQVPSNLTKGTSSGVCSAIIYGHFQNLLIGMWGGLDLLLDPYTGSTTGTTRVVVFQDADVAARYATAFSAMLDALTV